jgi:predicted RNA methylase
MRVRKATFSALGAMFGEQAQPASPPSGFRTIGALFGGPAAASPTSDDADAGPVSLPRSVRVVEPASGSTIIPADARPEPPYTTVATARGPRRHPILARYGDLAVHRSYDDEQSAAGVLSVTHEGSGTSLAHFTPRRAGPTLEPATLLEALAFAWDVNHQPATRKALDAVMRVVPRMPRKRALEAALKKHPKLFHAWVRANNGGMHGRVERYQRRDVLASASPAPGSGTRAARASAPAFARAAALFALPAAPRAEAAPGPTSRSQRSAASAPPSASFAGIGALFGEAPVPVGQPAARPGSASTPRAPEPSARPASARPAPPAAAVPSQRPGSTARPTLDEKAAAMWGAFSESERAGARVGLFPRGPMEQAEREGFDGKELSVALMRQAATHAAPPKPARAARPPRKPAATTPAPARESAAAVAASAPAPASSRAPSSRAPVPSSFARAAAELARIDQGWAAGAPAGAGATSAPSIRIVRFMVPPRREAAPKLGRRGLALLQAQEVYTGAPDQDGLYALRPTWGAAAVEMREMLRDVPRVRERDVTEEYTLGYTRAPREYDYGWTLSLDESDRARRLVAIPHGNVDHQAGRYESGNYRFEPLQVRALRSRLDVIRDMAARIERGEISEDAGHAALQAHDHVLDELGIMHDDLRAVAAYEAALRAGEQQGRVAPKAPAVDTTEIDQGWEEPPATVVSAREPQTSGDATRAAILDVVQAAGFQPNQGAAMALYREGFTATTVRRDLEIDRERFAERWKLVPPPSDAELDVLGRRLRTLGAAGYGGVVLRVVPHPTIAGPVDPQARAYIAEATEAGQRSYVGDGPMYLGEAQDVGLRVLRDGTARAALVSADASTMPAEAPATGGAPQPAPQPPAAPRQGDVPTWVDRGRIVFGVLRDGTAGAAPGATGAPPVATAAPPAAPPQRDDGAEPRIASAADVKRLPPGTRLRMVENALGRVDEMREIVRATLSGIEVRIRDESSKHNGEVSELRLRGNTVQPRPGGGFAVVDRAGKVLAAYVVYHVPSSGAVASAGAPQPAPQPPPAPAPTPPPKGTQEARVAREEGPSWTVTLNVLVRRQPQPGHPPKPADNVPRPWRVVTDDAGTQTQQSFWDQPAARAVFEREARERWSAGVRAVRAASPPATGPVPPDPATLNSAAALRQIEPGTRLRRLGDLPTWDDGLRIVVAVEAKPDRLVLRFDEASPKRAGEVMTTSLQRARVAPASSAGGLPDGFQIIFEHGLGTELYRFEDWHAPASMTPWRASFVRKQEAHVETERANVARWAETNLEQARDDLDEAKSDRDRAHAETRLADVAAVQRVGSFRGVDPARLARLIDHARAEDDDYLDDMLAAQEAGAFGAPSGQGPLFGSRAAWDPAQRPLSARFDEAQRHAMLAREPRTLEEHLLAAWGRVDAMLRGESPDDNYHLAWQRSRAATDLLRHVPVGSTRYRAAESEIGNLNETLLLSRPVPAPLVDMLQDEALARKVQRALEQSAQDDWPNNTQKVMRVSLALKAALDGDEARAGELVELLKGAWRELEVEQSLDPTQNRVLLTTKAGTHALNHAGDQYTLTEGPESRVVAQGSATTVALAIAALRAGETTAPITADHELDEDDDEVPPTRGGIPAPTKPIVPAPAGGIPAPTKPIVPAPAGSIPAPTKPIVPAPASGIPAPTKPIVPAAAPAGSIPAPTKPIVPAPTRPIAPAAPAGGIPAPTKPVVPARAEHARAPTSAPRALDGSVAQPRFREVDGRVYADAAGLYATRRLPGVEVKDEGDDIQFRTPAGDVQFVWTTRRDFEDQAGRSYLLDGRPQAVAYVLTALGRQDLPAATYAPAFVRVGEDLFVDARTLEAVRRLPGADTAQIKTGDIRYYGAKGIVDFEPKPNGTYRVEADASALDHLAQALGVEVPAAGGGGETPATDDEASEPSVVELLSPVEHRTAARRREANIKAMWLAAELEANPRPLTTADRETLLEYSDWGGIGEGIEKYVDRFPPGFPVPEKRQLIHAYFTPPAVCAEIARVVRPLLPGLVATDGKVHALEPSAGIGRFPLALSGKGFEALAWHCVEYSTVSHKMLRLLRPEIDLFHGPFERWIAERGADFAGRLKLVISNPPYGARNQAWTEDPDRSYRYKRADDYFLRRGLDLLGAGGLGVYIIPSGFLTGPGEDNRALREEVLRRHHLAAAFRLPGEVFSLANVVTDILIFRARGGMLAKVDEADQFILEGRYYEEFPGHILGEVVHHDSNDKRGWHHTAEGYTVVGEFTSIPPFEERPMCSTCQHLPAPAPIAPPPTPAAGRANATAAELVVASNERLAAAVALGRRVEAFLASVANPDVEPVGWNELHADLIEWVEALDDEGQPANGPPGKDRELLALAARELGPLGHDPPGGANWLLKAFVGKSERLIPSLANRPTWVPAFTGDANNPLHVGEYLFRTRGTVSVNDLPGQDASPLFAAGWSEDSTDPEWTERLEVRGTLFPPTDYLFGHIWPKFDRAERRAKLGDVQAAAQARRLLEVIQPASWDEIEVTPQDGFVPIELLAAWVAKALNHGTPVTLRREKGLVQVAGADYELHNADGFLSLSGEAALCLGWVNHDYVVFQPYVAKDSNDTVDEIRLRYARDWTERFRAWCDADPERQRLIEQSYQRARQGYRIPTFGGEPLTIARWNPAVVLNPHQCAGARRADAHRGGGIAFDVGVGKTFTILATLALARQQGRARRAAIVVPQPIALQWVANVKKALPDFRVVVIGVNQRTITRGLRTGMETSETDTAEERGQKWARFMGGEYDVAIVTYEAMPRTQMDQAAMLRFIEGVTDIEREVELRRRNAKRELRQREQTYQQKKSELEPKIQRQEEQLQEAKQYNQKGRAAKLELKLTKLRAKLKAAEDQYKNRKLTARQEAILEEGVGAWLAERLELPEGHKHDPITWQQLKIDWLAVDEAHNFKNLHMPSSREGGTVPKFMGNEGDGSHRAWHLYFRACDVQSRGGEVVLATATPLSNSPLEGYNLGKLINDGVWKRMGIHDPEAFIDRFCVLEPEEVMTADMSTDTRLACVGFKNLDELRTVVLAQWEFKSAEQAGLALPTATVETVNVDMNAAQDAKYDTYVSEIEEALKNPKKEGHKILGLLSRLASVAQHPQLDERFEWADAHLVKTPHCPKYDELAARVVAKPGCGHIVFSDHVPAHAWIRDVLIEAGVPANRIGILNAVVAPTAADRQRTAREFNGSDSVLPKYDVLIANSIGEEGVDLQRRACAIHHMDIGWNPKKFTQRNGRGVRQGNTLSNIAIFYYVSNRSQDGMRLDMIDHKQNWISSLIAGANKINNPAAQSNLSRNEILLLISRNPEETRKRLDALKAERAEERKKKTIQNAHATLRAVSSRFERARTDSNPAVVAENFSVAKQKLKALVEQPGLADVWPWATWAIEAERHPMLVPKEGGPVYETLRVAMPRLLDRSVLDYAEFGRVDGATIGTRPARAAHWDETSAEKVQQLRLTPEMRLDASGVAWPSDDQAGIDAAMAEKWLPRLHSGSGSVDAWKALGWTRAPDRFVAEQWARWGDRIVRGMAEMGGWARNLWVPGVSLGRLVFGLDAMHAEVIPPTLAGWQRFLELAPAAGIKFTELDRAGRWWFGRSIPRTLLSAARDDAPASSSVPRSGVPRSAAAAEVAAA